jgi:4-amino-4-deoxy-L-arabinose transferase-like glycosyltransferase
LKPRIGLFIFLQHRLAKSLRLKLYPMKENYCYIVCLCILAGLLYFPALGSRDFWSPVEPRYAEIARVMFAKGEWIVPTINGELYTDKPILYFWLVLIASKIVGAVNEWTVRLPPALGAVGFVLVTYVTGRDFFSARVGFIAAAILATTVRVIWEARWARVDMLFSFFFVLALYFAARSVLRKGRPHEILYGYLFIALATLTKGLIGVVLPALILVSFVIIRRDWRTFREARLPLGVAIFFLVAAPWFWLVNAATDGKWLSEFIYVHHLQRYTAGSGHREPFYYYFWTLPVDFLPWTIFAVSALVAHRPSRNVRYQPVTLFFVLWFLIIFIFFSLSNTKRDLYLLPGFPPIAFLVANYMNDLTNNGVAQDGVYRSLGLIFFHLLWVGALTAPVMVWFLRRDALSSGLPSVSVLAAGGLAGAYFIHRRQAGRLICATVLMMLFMALTGSFLIMPYIDQHKSLRFFSLQLTRRVPLEVPLYIYADTKNDFNYYTEREVISVIKSKSQVETLLSQHSRGYMLVKDRDLKRLGMIANDRIVAKENIGTTTWNLVCLGSQPPGLIPKQIVSCRVTP